MELRKIIRTIIHECLNESFGDERRGIGNFLETKNYNIKIGRLPEHLINIHDSVVNYWEDTLELFKYERQKLSKNTIIFSTQKYVSKSFIDKMDNEMYNSGDIVLCYDKNGYLWLLDGHHRLIYDRMNLKDSMVYIIPFDDNKEIDYLFYSKD